MRKLLFLSLLSLVTITVRAQNYSVQLQSGSFVPAENRVGDLSYKNAELVNGFYFRFIQFKDIPTEEQKRAIENKGVRLYNYLPHNTFTAAIPASLALSQIDDGNIRSIFVIEPRHKLDELLSKGTYPKWAKRGPGKIELNVLHHPGLSSVEVGEWLQQAGAKLLYSIDDIDAHRIIINTSQINTIAALPYIYYLEPFDDNPRPDNLVGRTDHRSNMLATDYSNGLKYDGTGVTVALNDDGVIGPHIDYHGRMYGQFITNNSGDHGDHCAGTIFAAGNRNPVGRGMAFGAQLGAYGVGGFPSGYQAFDSINSHYNKHGVRITSTSYSNGNNSGYTSLARMMDIQTNTMPQLIHVFSAGNAGSSDFGWGAGPGWANITGGHKQAKNVMTTGNLNYTDGLSTSSSRGPARDGRIKPDICAVGSSVYSTSNPHNYVTKSGTSMACPGIAGTLAQLYHAYKSLNSGNNPRSALMKAVMLNTADDLGNAGPDYKFGWGRVNARRALTILQNNQYSYDSVTHTGVKNHTITVPSGVSEVRVMVYWHDYEATAGAAKALVNNLDMKVTTPSSTQVFPWILNPTKNATLVNLPAVQGVDTLNNVEQVTIPNPAAGNYTVTVTGTQVPQGPQRYYMVYEFVNSDVTLIYPSGGESLVPGIQETIRWDAHGNSGTFSLQYSANNGATWSNIATTVSSSLRHFDWTPPSTVTGEALIRVTRGSSSDQSNAPFSIIGVPTNLNVVWVCYDSLLVTYSSVTGATGYIVSILGQKYMDSAGSSTTTSCVVKGVNTLQPGWFSVQATGPNNCKGRRALAQQYQALPFNCTITTDIAVTNGISPVANTAISCNATPFKDSVRIEIKNNGNTNMSNIPVKYAVDNAAPVSEVFAGPVNPFATATFTFSQPVTLSTAGTHDLKVWAEAAGDLSPFNDTFSWQKTISYPVVKPLPLSQDFETFTLCDTSANCGLHVCNLADGWTNDLNNIDDSADWRINSGPTPSAIAPGTTGPQQDFKPGTPDGQYAYIEASDCFGEQANLISPCIDLSGALSPKLKFAYHMSGSAMGELHVDVLTDGQWTDDIMPVISGDQGNSWKSVIVPLAGFGGKIVNVRFRGVTGAGLESDIAIDDVSFFNAVNVTDVHNDLQMDIYPNPSDGYYTLRFAGVAGKVELVVTDIRGRVMLEKSGTVQQGITTEKLDLNNAPAGVYLLTVQAGDQKHNYKLVKY